MASSRTISDSSLITLILDDGNHRTDLAFPAGVTLQEAMNAVDIGRLRPYTLTGRLMRPGAVLGQDISSGALILLRSEGWDVEPKIIPVDHSAEVRASNTTVALGITAIVTGVLTGMWALLFQTSALTPPDTWVYASLIGAFVLVSVLLACRTSVGKPLIEVGGPAALIFAAASLSTFVNPGDHTHQLLIVAALGISMVSLIRWVACGKKAPNVGNVCIDTSVIMLVVALIDVGVMVAGLPIEFTAAIIFGLCPPLLNAISGFSIRVPSDVLLDSEAVIREAPAVRNRTVDTTDPDVGNLMLISAARNRLWTFLTCLGLLITAPALVNLVAIDSWRGTVTFFAFLTAIAACLLVPRKSSSRFVRVLPRITAGYLVTLLALSGQLRLDPFVTAVILLCMAGLFLGATFFMKPERRFYGFSRIGDILQSLSVASSLPLALAAIGVISLVRTGGLG